MVMRLERIYRSAQSRPGTAAMIHAGGLLLCCYCCIASLEQQAINLKQLQLPDLG